MLYLFSIPSGFSEGKRELFNRLEKTAYNFRQVETDIYRSGKISKEAVPALKGLGIKTVISFDDWPSRIEKEKGFLKDSGIEFISIPWSGFDYPEDGVIEKIHAVMKNPAKRPILVHCKHGQERTGVVIATWRIAEEGWDVHRAYQEMRSCGFRPFQYGHLKNYVYDFAKRRGQSAKIEKFEQAKTDFLYRIYQLRKLNPFKKTL